MKGVPSSRYPGGPPNGAVVLSGALSVVLISLLITFLGREAPLSLPDAGSLKVLEHKTPRICGEQGSRDVVLMQNLAHLSTRSGEYRLGHRASLSL
jgi:hypothetical protein